MNYRTTSLVLDFRAGENSCVGQAGAAEMAGLPHGLSRSPARGSFAGKPRKPAGGGGIIWSSLHLAVLNAAAKGALWLADALADGVEAVR